MQDKFSHSVTFLLTRLKTVLNIKTDIALAEHLGISSQAISNWKARNVIDYDLILTKCVGVDLNWLIRGEKVGPPFGPPFGPPLEDPLKKSKRRQYLVEGNREDFMAGEGIPYFEELKATAGDIPSFLQQAKPTSYIKLPQIKDCQAILPVYGNSMKGLIESGDLIAIKEIISRQEFDPSVPYLIITEEHRMIKFLRADSKDEQTIWATSTNHEPIRLFVENIKKVYAIRCVIRFF